MTKKRKKSLQVLNKDVDPVRHQLAILGDVLGLKDYHADCSKPRTPSVSYGKKRERCDLEQRGNVAKMCSS